MHNICIKYALNCTHKNIIPFPIKSNGIFQELFETWLWPKFHDKFVEYFMLNKYRNSMHTYVRVQLFEWEFYKLIRFVEKKRTLQFIAALIRVKEKHSNSLLLNWKERKNTSIHWCWTERKNTSIHCCWTERKGNTLQFIDAELKGKEKHFNSLLLNWKERKNTSINCSVDTQKDKYNWIPHEKKIHVTGKSR